MTATLLLILSAFLLYCFSDIKYRSTPAVEIFFLGAIAIAIGGGDFAKISVVVLAVCFGLFSSVPRQIGYCLMFFPGRMAGPECLVTACVGRSLVEAIYTLLAFFLPCSPGMLLSRRSSQCFFGVNTGEDIRSLDQFP